MTNAQLLQDAFGLVDDAIIDKAANTYVAKRRVSRWPVIVAAAAAAVALVFLMTSPIHHPGERILSAKNYAIYHTDGVYTIHGGSGGSVGGSSGVVDDCQMVQQIKFSGLSDMRRIIFEGQLSDRALQIMRVFPKSKSGGVLLFDPDNMQDIVVPDDIHVNNLIIWYGCAYQFELSNDVLSGTLTYDVVDDSETRAEDMIWEGKNAENLSVTYDPERDATVTVFGSDNSESAWKQIVYTQTAGNKTVTFVEKYMKGANQEVPDSIHFWGTDNNNYFYGWFSNIKERPSLDYLMQFGLKPYEEE